MLSIDAAKQAAKMIFGIDQQEATKGTGYAVPVTPEQAFSYNIAVREDRKSRIQDCSKMVATDGRFARLIYKLASDASIGGFTVNVTEAPTESQKDIAQRMINATIKKCDLIGSSKMWVMEMLKEGDLMLENIVDDRKREITRIKKLATEITMSNMDIEGNFPEGETAYYQAHPWTNQPIKTFEAWQINHVGWMKSPDQRYGLPMFTPARLSWQQLIKGENNMMIRRALGSGTRQHHKIGDTNKPDDWTAVDDYIKKMEDTKANPLDPVQHFYTSAHVDITELRGDTTVGEMADLQHFESNAVVISGVPYGLLGGGRERSINRDILKEQEEDYYKVIKDITDSLEVAFRRTIDFQLLLYGVNPDSIVYTMDWGAKDREDIDVKIDRGKALQALGFSFETVFATCNVTGVSYEEELERIKRQVGDGFPYYGIGTKLDQNLALLVSGLLGQTPGNTPATEIDSEMGNRIADELHLLRRNGERAITPQLIALRK